MTKVLSLDRLQEELSKKPNDCFEMTEGDIMAVAEPLAVEMPEKLVLGESFIDQDDKTLEEGHMTGYNDCIDEIEQKVRSKG